MFTRPTLKVSLMVLILAVACLPLLGAGVFLLHFVGATFERQIAEGNLLTARTAAGEVARFLQNYQSVLEYAGDEWEAGSGVSDSQSNQRLERLIHRHTLLGSIRILDQQARVISLAPFLQDHVGLDLSGQLVVQTAMLTGKPAWSQVYLSERTGYPAVSLAIPFPFGAVVGDLDLVVLQGITEEIKTGYGGYATMTDREGITIAHPSRKLVFERLNLKNLDLIQQGLAGREGTYRYRFAGEDHFGSVVRIPETGWLVAIVQPEKMALVPIQEMRRFLWAGLGILILTLLPLTFFGLRKALNPLFHLADEARRIAGGDYRVQPLSAIYPEIDQLAQSLTAMTRAIRDRQEALSRSEERYRHLVEGSFDGIFIQRGSKIVFANQRLIEMLGYTMDELLGLDHWILYHGEYRAQTRERALARMRGEPLSPHYEARLQHKNGSWFYGELSARLIDVEGEPGIQVWIKDVSERKQAEEALNRSEKRFEELYDTVSDLIYTQDLEGRFLTVNRAMTTLFAYKEGDLIGRCAAEFMKPDLRSLFDAEYLTKVKRNGSHRGVTAYFTRDHQKIYLDYVSTLVQPKEGEPFISGIARDVTERIRAQRAIREREQRIKAFLEATPNPLVVYDPEGIPQYLNPAFTNVFGWTLDEIKDKPIPFVPDDQQDKTLTSIRESYEKHIGGTLETQRLTKDGHLLDILISAALIKEPKGKPLGMVVTLTNITESKRMKESLLQAEKMEAIGVLAGGIAHDFNNLLMAIEGNICLMLKDIQPGHPFFRRLNDMEKYAHQGATLTRQLLGFAKGGKYEVRPLDLNALISSHNQIFGRTRKDIRIQEAFEEGLWAVAADEGQMSQVLMNLYLNAAQAMPDGGTIFSSTRNRVLQEGQGKSFQISPGRFVQVSIQDTGEGIPPEIRARLFEPFFTTREMGRGTGLGLASVFGIVKNHGGFIEVESEMKKGSTFHIYLPATDASDVEQKTTENPEALEERETETGQPGQRTILLVDDEEMVLDVGREILEVMGYRTYTAASAAKAIALFERYGQDIDLVILDMIMPDMGGGALFDKLKSLDPNVKTILSSGYSMDGQAQAILSRGCKGFLQKPFKMKELDAKIKSILK